MSTIFYSNIVYIFGPDTTNLSPDDHVSLKIGFSKNNPTNYNHRLSEHQRSHGNSVAHGKFETNQTDTPVREYLCKTYPMLVGYVPGVGSGIGREVVMLRVKDVPFILEQATRYFNAVNKGDSPDKGKLNSFVNRHEQKSFIDKLIAFFSDPANDGREFLCDAKMRFGKTHCTYEVITALDYKLVLIATGRPTDTKKAWIDGMDHVNFDLDSSNFIDASKQGDTPIVANVGKRTIIFVSTQDLDLTKEKFKNFFNMVFDLIVKDEYHLSFDTDRTKDALSKLNCKHVLNLSGTPFLALLQGRFADDAKFTWSYLNEQNSRAEELTKLGQENAEKDGQYYWLCPMKIFTILLSQELYKDADLFTEEEGFTFTKLFSVEEKNGKHYFRNDVAVKAFLNSLCHGFVMPYSSQAHVSRQYVSDYLKHSLWYLPGVKEANILREMLRKHETFKKYDIIIAAGDNGEEGNDTVELVTSRIADIESGRNPDYIGTITLVCGKLTHGVSIPEWGSIFNLSDMRSAQLYFQLIFRGQTPWKGRKHECYVFDFNPNRTLTCMYKLAEAAAPTGNVVPILSEILNVFNVLCYEGNAFHRVNATELLSKFESGFGKASSLTGLQTLLSELPVDIDTELGVELNDIEGGSSSKTKEVDVNKNDTPNGKNSKSSSNHNDDDSSSDSDSKPDKNEQQLSDEQKVARLKAALKTVPLYLFLTEDNSFDEFISNLDNALNASICKKITGLSSKSLKKILSSQSKDKRQQINLGITRFRSLELKDHEASQS